MELTALQDQLDAFLAYAVGGVLLWDDPDGHCERVLGSLSLPGDVALLREEEGSRFALKCRLNDMAPDERVLLYRTRRHRVEDGDWLADLEAHAACFEPEESAAEDVPVADAAARALVSSESPVVLDDAFGALAAQLQDDWYSLPAFRHIAGQVLEDRQDLPDVALAQQLGFALYADCVLRVTWDGLTAYYASLLKGALISHDSVSEAIRASGTFRSFLYQRMAQGLLLDYGDGMWIGREGLAELGITDGDLKDFAEGAAAACDEEGIAYLTVPWLRRSAPDLALLRYELPDAFYESVLLMSCFELGRSSLCGRRLFSVRGASSRGRDFLLALVARDRSMPMEDLLEIVRDGYGIPVSPAQLVQLVKSSGTYYRRELDYVFVDYDQFVREME